jgi:hypothetical protein
MSHVSSLTYIVGTEYSLNRKVYATHRCVCGVLKDLQRARVRRGEILSCGCLRDEKSSIRLTKHGKSKSAEYRAYHQMIARCYNKNSTYYCNYGGRGVAVCDRWLESFENFYEDMGDKPSPSHSLERKNNNKGYSAENCKWATVHEQNNNRRNSVQYLGETMTEASIRLGCKSGRMVSERIYAGWSIEKAFTTPKKKYG